MRGSIQSKVWLLLIAIFTIFLTSVNMASVWAASDTKQRVYDFAQLLTSDQAEKLEAMAEKYGAKRETDFIILTTDDTQGKDIVKYMQDFYDEKALGYNQPHGNTAILTIDMSQREVYLAGFYKAEEYLDNSRMDLIRNRITSDLSNGDYYEAFRDFIQTSHQYMGIKPGVNPDNILFNFWFQLIASLAVGGIVVGIMLYNSGGKVTVNERTYRDFQHSRVVDQRDEYIRTTVTKRKKPSEKSGGGKGFGGGGGGVTGGGHSHSGSRGKF